MARTRARHASAHLPGPRPPACRHAPSGAACRREVAQRMGVTVGRVSHIENGELVVSKKDMRLVPVVAVRQNVYPAKGKGLAVQGGKTATALRIVPCPSS